MFHMVHVYTQYVPAVAIRSLSHVMIGSIDSKE